MHINFSTLLIGAALAASIFLLLHKSDRMVPTIAALAAGVELLLAMGIMSLSVPVVRIDVILPAVLLVAGLACWARASDKGSITAASGLGMVGALQLMLAVGFVGG